MEQQENISHLDQIQQLYQQYEMLVVHKFNRTIKQLFAEKEQVTLEQIDDIPGFITTHPKDQQLLELAYKKIKTPVGIGVAAELAELFASGEFLGQLKRALDDPEFALGFTKFLTASGFFAIQESLSDVNLEDEEIITESNSFAKLVELDPTSTFSFHSGDNEESTGTTLHISKILRDLFTEGNGHKILAQLPVVPRGKTHVTASQKNLLNAKLLQTVLLLFPMTQAFSEQFYMQHALKKTKVSVKNPVYPKFITRLANWQKGERLSFEHPHKELLETSIIELTNKANTLLLKYVYPLDMNQENVSSHLKHKLKYHVNLLLDKEPFLQGDLFNFYDSLVVAELLHAYLKNNNLNHIHIFLPKRIEDFAASVDIYLFDTTTGHIIPIDITGIDRQRKDFEEKQIRAGHISFHERTLIQFVDKSVLPYAVIEKVKVISTIQGRDETHDWLYRYMQQHMHLLVDMTTSTQVDDLGSHAYALLSGADKSQADSLCRELLPIT